MSDDKKEFAENPFDPHKIKPEDIARIFYVNDVPLIPVISKRGLLLGILKKNDLISELSDIERTEKLSIDKFVTKLAKKMSFEELIPYGNIKEYTVINIFGEIQGKWSRLQLFSAVESPDKKVSRKEEIENQKEDQILEWIIYLILEYIPRPLYAINDRGSTIFYNSLFEDIYIKKFNKSEVDSKSVEKSLKRSASNEIFSENSNNDMIFYNKDLDIYYEKIPMYSRSKIVGYLIFCDIIKEQTGGIIPGINMKGMSLEESLKSFERFLLVKTLENEKDLNSAAEKLKISRRSMKNKMNTYGITFNNSKEK